MSEPNQDYRQPTAETFLYGLVSYEGFALYANLPIYWGPGQATDPFPAYHPPDPRRWRNYEHLSIPRVARFIYTNADFIPDDKYSDDGGGGTPTTQTWVVVRTVPLQPPSDFYQYRVYWEKLVNGIPQEASEISYIHVFKPTPEAYFAGLELELPYGDVPNYSNDGAPF